MNPILFLTLTAALIGGALLLVALPILQQARRTSFPPTLTSEQEGLDDLLANRDAAFQALRELGFDHRVGKITHEDFVAFEAHLKRNAAESLRALDEWERGVGDASDQAMERAISERRHTLTHGPGAFRDGHDAPRTCSQCGKPASVADQFCGACGAALPALPTSPTPATPEIACPHCGHACQPEDRFCAGCGQGLAAKIVSRSAS